jgi:hypothetical protein
VTSGSDAIWNVYEFFFHSKEGMHEIKFWGKKSRTKRFGNLPRLRPGTRIIQQSNLFTMKKNKGNESVYFSRLKWSIAQSFSSSIIVINIIIIITSCGCGRYFCPVPMLIKVLLYQKCRDRAIDTYVAESHTSCAFE